MEAKINLSWKEMYVGIRRDFISPKKALENINSACFENVSIDLIGELYSKEDDKHGFLFLLDSFIDFTNEDVENTMRFWMRYYLEKVYNSNLSIKDKLNEIAVLWASFEYPNEWREFINYLPVIDGGKTGEEYLYKKFEIYLKDNLGK